MSHQVSWIVIITIIFVICLTINLISILTNMVKFYGNLLTGSGCVHYLPLCNESRVSGNYLWYPLQIIRKQYLQSEYYTQYLCSTAQSCRGVPAGTTAACEREGRMSTSVVYRLWWQAHVACSHSENVKHKCCHLLLIVNLSGFISAGV